jgi:hypothetical protein
MELEKKVTTNKSHLQVPEVIFSPMEGFNSVLQIHSEVTFTLLLARIINIAVALTVDSQLSQLKPD